LPPNFFDQLDIIAAAVDNFAARRYLVRKVFLHPISVLFDSGTLGLSAQSRLLLRPYTQEPKLP
jgi:molybdopterin/thiamine biosynthesis adenylyltransferase